MAAKMPDSPPLTYSTSLQDGVDNLWKFQLRKENAALLENQQAHYKLLQAIAAESAKTKRDFDEKFAALEAIALNLQSDERKDRLAIESWSQDVRALKVQVGIVAEKQDKQISDAQLSDTSTDAPSRNSIENLTNASTTSIPNKISTDATHQKNSKNPPHANIIGVTSTPITNVATSRIIKSNNSHGPVTRSRSRNRSQSGSVSAPMSSTARAPTPAPTATSIPTPTLANQPTKIPRLHQGTSTLKTYLDRANRTFMSLPNYKDEKFEIEFIALFIRGMRETNQREVLVRELMQWHPSRTKKNGNIEVLCVWEQVGEGMITSGLLTRANMASSGQKDEKRG